LVQSACLIKSNPNRPFGDAAPPCDIRQGKVRRRDRWKRANLPDAMKSAAATA
jgi:hypothetical protein